MFEAKINKNIIPSKPAKSANPFKSSTVQHKFNQLFDNTTSFLRSGNTDMQSNDNVQCKSSNNAAQGNPTATHQAAASGVQGTGSQLPHFSTIQKAFGKYDISHIKSYTGAKATDASNEINAEAYAVGNKVAFKDNSPSLHTVAHEAAHVIQQQAGVHLKQGVGQTGDRYEQHADAVADKVIKGESAEGLLQKYSPSLQSGNNCLDHSSGVVQRKMKWGGSECDELEDLYTGSAGKGNQKKRKATKELVEKIKTDTDYKEAFNHLIKDKKLKYTFTGATKDHQHRLKQLENFLQAYKVEKGVFALEVPGLKVSNQEDEAYLKLLDRIIKRIKLMKNEKAPGIEREEIQSAEGIPESWHFLPSVKDKSTSEESFDLRKYNATVESTTVKSKTQHDDEVAGSMLGFSAQVTGTGSTNAPALTNPTSWKTNVKWDPAVNHIGQKMEAKPLGPDHKLGSKPKSNTVGAKAAKDMETIAEGKIEGGKTKYVQGHLLNEQLGGPGDDARNLVPFTSQANAIHKTKVENQIKNLVNLQHKWVNYKVEVQPGDMSDKYLKDNRTPQTIRDLANKYGKKYPAVIKCTWGLASDDQGGYITGAQNTVNINVQDPIKLRYKDETKTGTDDETKDLTKHKEYYETKVDYKKVILTTSEKIKARLLVGMDYEAQLQNTDGLITTYEYMERIIDELNPETIVEESIDLIKLRDNFLDIDTEIKDQQSSLTETTEELKTFNEDLPISRPKSPPPSNQTFSLTPPSTPKDLSNIKFVGQVQTPSKLLGQTTKKMKDEHAIFMTEYNSILNSRVEILRTEIVNSKKKGKITEPQLKLLLKYIKRYQNLKPNVQSIYLDTIDESNSAMIAYLYIRKEILEKYVIYLQEKNKSKQTILETQKLKIEKLASGNKEKDKEIVKLKEELKKLKEGNEQLKEENEELKKSNEFLEEENTELKSENKELKTKLKTQLKTQHNQSGTQKKKS